MIPNSINQLTEDITAFELYAQQKFFVMYINRSHKTYKQTPVKWDLSLICYLLSYYLFIYSKSDEIELKIRISTRLDDQKFNT